MKVQLFLRLLTACSPRKWQKNQEGCKIIFGEAASAYHMLKEVALFKALEQCCLVRMATGLLKIKPEVLVGKASRGASALGAVQKPDL